MNSLLVNRLSNLVGVFSVVLLVAALALTTMTVTSPEGLDQFTRAESSAEGNCEDSDVLCGTITARAFHDRINKCEGHYESADRPLEGILVTLKGAEDRGTLEATTNGNGYVFFNSIGFPSMDSVVELFSDLGNYDPCTSNQPESNGEVTYKIAGSDMGALGSKHVNFLARGASGPTEPEASATTTPSNTPTPKNTPTPGAGAQCPDQDPPNSLSDCGDPSLYNADTNSNLTINNFSSSQASLGVSWDNVNAQQYRVAVFYYIDETGGVDPDNDGTPEGDYALAGWSSLIKVDGSNTSTTVTDSDFDPAAWQAINDARSAGKAVELAAVTRAVYHSTDDYVSDPEQCSCRSDYDESSKQAVPVATPTAAPPATPTTGPQGQTHQLDWILGNGRCWSAWAESQCGLTDNLGEDFWPGAVVCEPSAGDEQVTITNNTSSAQTVTCQINKCDFCSESSNDDNKAECLEKDSGETVTITTGCSLTCTRNGIVGECAPQQAEVKASFKLTNNHSDTTIDNVVAKINKGGDPTTRLGENLTGFGSLAPGTAPQKFTQKFDELASGEKITVEGKYIVYATLFSGGEELGDCGSSSGGTVDGGGTVDISCTLENDGSVSTQETVVTTPTPMPTATPAPGVSVTPGTPTATTAPQKDSDINDDGYVDGADVAAVVASYSTAQGDAEYNPKADFCGPTAAGSDGRINAYEVSCLIRDWNPRR